jgi:hypothetical protein
MDFHLNVYLVQMLWVTVGQREECNALVVDPLDRFVYTIHRHDSQDRAKQLPEKRLTNQGCK